MSSMQTATPVHSSPRPAQVSRWVQFLVLALALVAFLAPIPTFAQSPGITFATPQRIPWGIGRIAFGHISRTSGPLDVMSSDDGGPNSSRVWIYANDGNGTLSLTDTLNVPLNGFNVEQSVLADVNNDGFDDVIALGRTGFCVYLNNGSGRFLSAPTCYYNAGGSANSYFPADFQGLRIDAAKTSPNGNVDLILSGVGIGATSTVLVFHGNGDGTFAPHPLSLNIHHWPYPAWFIKFADVERNGYPAIVATGGDNQPAVVFRNNRDGTYTETFTLYPPPYYMANAQFIDMDNDGTLDAVIATGDGSNGWLGNIYWYKGLGGATFETTPHLAFAGQGAFRVHPNDWTWHNDAFYSSLATGDVDGDGQVDLLASAGQMGLPVVLRNNGDGTFTEAWSASRTDTNGNPAFANMLYFVDLNGTGERVLVGANYRNNSWQRQTPYGEYYGPNLARPVDKTPPVVTVPANLTVEATGPSGAVVTFAAAATDDVDGPLSAVCTPSSGSTFALGITTVLCSATDAAQNTGSASFTVTVRDTTAPLFTAGPTPSSATLWPPNHQMVPITVTAEAFDAVGAVVMIFSVTSNEPDNGLGDGDTANDIEITGALRVNLRAERSGTGNGRIYTIAVEARDAAGNTTTRMTTVSVPKSQRR